MSTIRKLATFSAIVILFGYCRKPAGANWDVDIVLPVVNSQLNIQNFLGDSIFKSDPSGLLHLSINREVASLKLDSMVTLPDTSIITTFTSPAITGVPLEHNSPFSTALSDIVFKPDNNVLLKTVEIRDGVLQVNFSNDLTEALDLYYELPSVRKNGQSFKIKETIPPGVNSLNREYDMSGFVFDLRGRKGNSYNTVAQNYTLMLNPDASTLTVYYGQGAKVAVNYRDIIPEFIEGNFGRQHIKLSADTTAFNLAGTLKATGFVLPEATMRFTIENAFGADFSAGLSGISSINSYNGISVDLATTQLSGMNLNAATRNGTTVTQTQKIILLNNANSNISGFISNFPDKISYAGNIYLNPEPIQLTDNHFAFYNTGINFIADIDIPLRLQGGIFRLISNASVDLSNFEQLDHVNNGRLVVRTVNSYPLSAELQVFMIDKNGVVFDSLFVPGEGRNVIEKAMLNVSAQVTAPSESELLIPMNREKIENLKKCVSMRIHSGFIVPSGTSEIRILESSALDLRIIAELNYNVRISSR